MSSHESGIARPADPLIRLTTTALFATALLTPSNQPGRASAADPAPPPNFIIIMADDMGYADASFNGGTAFRTPHLDRLAAEGLRFTDFHSNGAVCSPTRAALLTGRYQQRAGLPAVVVADPSRAIHEHGVQPVELTFAEALKARGYDTAVIGKWHLGYKPNYNPIHHGFDRFRGYVSGNVDFISHIDQAGNFDWWHDEKLNREEEGYTTHLITKHAVRFIEEHRAAASSPFCLYIAHEAPHYPYQGPDDPPVRKEGSGRSLWNDREPQHAARAYRQMMTELDRSVGQVIEAVRNAGLENNTLIWFFSDNGGTGPGDNGPLRGRKGTVWEGGHRVPAVAWWPGRMKPGTITHATTMTMDVMPTILALAGAQQDADRPPDGADLSPLLLEGKPPAPRKLFWQHGRDTAMRDGPWKLVTPGRGNTAAMLFNLDDDLGEQNDLADEQPQRVKQMQAAIAAWADDVNANATPQPAPN